MSQLCCEICGSTQLLKKDGVFVCQNCQCSYTVEELKKMMSGAGSAPAAAGVPAAPAAAVSSADQQINNLLNLARSSYESKNYAQAEQFCNQIIAIDSQNYEAWKYKGLAVNYQVTASNARFLEAYNCVLTSYRVLSPGQQREMKSEVLSVLTLCLNSELAFQVSQFEASRPSNTSLSKVKVAYLDLRTKILEAFAELRLADELEVYLLKFDSYFVQCCSNTCASAWKTTVAYNYYREYLGQGIDPFGRSLQDQRWVIPNTNLYRPMKATWDTFVVESDTMIQLLEYAESKFNEYTHPDTIKELYGNIINFQQHLIPSGSWNIISGFAGLWDTAGSIGWHEQFNFSDGAKQARREIIGNCSRKSSEAVKKAKEVFKERHERECRECIEQFWAANPQEKQQYDELIENIASLESRIAAIHEENAPAIADLKRRRRETIPEEKEVFSQLNLVRELEAKRDACGIFKGKEKKALTERIDTIEKPRLEKLRSEAAEAKKKFGEEIEAKLRKLSEAAKDLEDECKGLTERRDAIIQVITKDID